ncbi:MAG: hypothetical protein KGH69_04355 [Candidatus Micrarchaeota archaeon]|nr:hypothetical protein [Candidatus Micrarchaeota archaeon]
MATAQFTFEKTKARLLNAARQGDLASVDRRTINKIVEALRDASEYHLKSRFDPEVKDRRLPLPPNAGGAHDSYGAAIAHVRDLRDMNPTNQALQGETLKLLARIERAQERLE